MSNCGALLRLFLVPRMMITASWPSKVFITSSFLSTSPTTTLDTLWSAGSLVGSRTSTVTLYPDGGKNGNETKQQGCSRNRYSHHHHVDIPTHQIHVLKKKNYSCIVSAITMQPNVISSVIFPKIHRISFCRISWNVQSRPWKSGRRCGRMRSSDYYKRSRD